MEATSIKVSNGKYKGFEYIITVSVEEGKAFFSSEGPFGRSSNTYAETFESFKSDVDKFMETIPSTQDEWLEEITNCMVWTGYEDCHMDKDMVLVVLSKAKKHYKEGL